jgi:release factor glutamine methyltransferase
VTTTYQEPNALGRATLQPSRAKSAVRTAIHLLSYYFILKRRRAAQTRVAGFRLIVPPTVFHPRYFLTSAFFAQFVSKLDLSGKRIADVGTGSGILALAAAQAGGATVLALDINPNAAQAAAENAYANGFGGSISAVGSNLLSAVMPRPLFDVVLYQVLPRSPANPATWPTALGPLVQTIGISRCCSLRLAKGSRPMAACTCSSPRIPISTCSEPL